MNPVPDYPDVDTPYGKRGPYWSCDRDAQGNGIHTGVDLSAPQGAKVIAARSGTLAWCAHGSSFGDHQVEVRCSDGTRDFYAHLSQRVEQGDVAAGEKVGEVGEEGNATGPHLHFERHATLTGPWSCSVVRDPQPSIDYQPKDVEEMNEKDWDRMKNLLDDTVEKVWNEKIDVTRPGTGEHTQMKARQLLRETWQKITKAT